MDKLVFERKEAAKQLGVSLVTFDRLLRRAERPIPSFRVGARVCIPVDGLRSWIEEETARNTVVG